MAINIVVVKNIIVLKRNYVNMKIISNIKYYQFIKTLLFST